MARVPTTITCWRINEKLDPERNLSLWVAKTTIASASAARGPMIAEPPRMFRAPDRRLVTRLTSALMGHPPNEKRAAGLRPAASQSGRAYLVPQQLAVPYAESLLSTPLWALSVIRVTPVSV